jgi:hypothetical protein
MNHVRQEDHYQADASGREDRNQLGRFSVLVDGVPPAS